jgi:putative ABC transport system substrate-binding protein
MSPPASSARPVGGESRRLLLATGLALLLLPEARGQAATRAEHRVGWLVSGAISRGLAYQHFVEQAATLGYTVDKNLLIDYRAFASTDEGTTAAAALVQLKVDVIVAQGPPALLAARAATATIPIVTFFIGDPIRMGVSRSLARPDGNVTGFTWDAGAEATGKVLEVIREMLPRTTRVGLLWTRENDSHPLYVEEFKSQGRRLGMSLLSSPVSAPSEFATALRALRKDRAQAIVAFADPFTFKHRGELSLAIEHNRLPVVWTGVQWPLDGALLTYGPNVEDQPRRAAEYVIRILKGSRPSDLPFQQPTRDALIVDSKVAHALGIALPATLLTRADKVIGR